jgi:hypothetical protein
VIEQVKADAARYFADSLAGPRTHILRRRPATVEAMQVHVGFEVQVADFCGGVPVYGRGVVVWTGTGDLAHADYGDWVVRGPRGTFDVVDDGTIFAEFEAILP